LANSLPYLGARDLLHLAIMQRVGATSIVTADSAFDAVASVQRLDPSRLVT
jgi:predicted nucleic acid-binding protein